VFAWGHPDKGCLGNGTDGKFFITASKLTFHFEFSPIEVLGWCEKVDGAMGEGREKAEMQPVATPKIIDVQCGPEHTVALAEDGNVFTWGFGAYGRLGHTDNVDQHWPRQIEHFKPANPHTKGCTFISVGGSCAVAMTKSLGHPYFWGQLKSSGEATMYPKIYTEGMGEPPRFIGVGNKHVCIGTDSNVYSLGSSPCYGELGHGARFSTEVYTRGAPIIEFHAFALLEALPCVVTNGVPLGRPFLTGSHCKLRPNTEGTAKKKNGPPPSSKQWPPSQRCQQSG
jgi:alpha-tubulin suppressor-like RCC1 family protein